VVARSDGVEVLGHDLQLPLDTAGYSRRACPHCKAGFKVRVSRRDARVVAAALARRVVHLNASEARPGDVPRHCPYCGARADAEAFWTEEHRAWLDREASSFERELRWRRLRAPLDHLAQTRLSPSSLLAVVVQRRVRGISGLAALRAASPQPGGSERRSPQPPQRGFGKGRNPIQNPRPTYVPVTPRPRRPDPLRDDGQDQDLTGVPLPCCGEEVKVSDGWSGPVRCHFCGMVHTRAVSRDIGLELALLREWARGA